MALDKLGFGLGVTLLCMSIVFVILVLLSYVIRLQRVIVEKIDGLKTQNAVPQKTEKAVAPQVAAVQEESEELIAVISAAIAAVLGRPVSNIKVRSIRRLEPATPSWSAAGRQDQINTRF